MSKGGAGARGASERKRASVAPATNADLRFVEDLAAALGPLYRLSILRGDGTVESTVRAPEETGAPARTIRLPGSDDTLLIEVDVLALQGADRVLHALARAPWETPIGLPHLDRALAELVAAGEAWIGRPVSKMSRLDKQRLVKFLDERGAFSLRKSVDAVGDMLGVSRFTVYNYLEACREA